MELRAKFDCMTTDDGGVCRLSFVADEQACRTAVARMRTREMQGRNDYVLKVSEYREKRSLNANAYFWRLCGELARVIRTTPESIYRKYIADTNNYESIWVKRDAMEEFKRKWESNGIGWIAVRVDAVDPRFELIHAYYGSSTYTREQMQELIDFVVEDCKGHGIETRTPDEIAAMLAAWGVA